MNRHRRIVLSPGRNRNASALRPRVESLDARILLCADGSLHHPLAEDRVPGRVVEAHELDSVPAIEVAAGAALVAAAAAGPVGLAPLSSIPALNSLLGAAATLYLDFDGHFESQWGSFRNITTPAFDQDGDAATFSDSELSAIARIWESVAEDYAPFHINVTTVQPPSFADGVALRVSIGGDGVWTGGSYGGIAYVDSFTNSIVNTAFVFAKNLANGHAKYTAEGSAHESGHSFGLQHQSQYSGTRLVNEYYAGPGDGRAPILGNSYGATRGLWWYGTSVASTTYQDDMAVIARSRNRFGYRADDHGNTAAGATPLTVSSAEVGGAGIIERTSDLDVFSLTTDAGTISLTVDVPAGVNNLDARLELRDATGTTLITADAPATSFGATVTAAVAAGSYRLVVASQGHYGDVGRYTVRGTIVPPIGGIAAPTGLTASAVSPTQVNLSWTDNATNETGYRVERSTDGTAWVTLATTATDATAHADTTTAAGTTNQYRVRAFSDTTTSASSNPAGATTVPVAPGGLTATAVSSSQINLSWGDVAGEMGYRVERSTDGIAWTVAGTTGANVTTFQDTRRTADTTYQYRVQATNTGGASAASEVASARTLAVPTPPAAPSALVAVAASKSRVDLVWNDNAGDEAGFRIERSTNGGKSWAQIAQVGANVTTSTDLSVTGRATYSYRVRAFNTAGNSASSNVATVTTPRAGLEGLTFGATGERSSDLPPSVAGVLLPADPRPAPVVVGTPSGGATQESSGVIFPATVDQVLAEWTRRGPSTRRPKKVLA